MFCMRMVNFGWLIGRCGRLGGWGMVSSTSGTLAQTCKCLKKGFSALSFAKPYPRDSNMEWSHRPTGGAHLAYA